MHVRVHGKYPAVNIERGELWIYLKAKRMLKGSGAWNQIFRYDGLIEMFACVSFCWYNWPLPFANREIATICGSDFGLGRGKKEIVFFLLQTSKRNSLDTISQYRVSICSLIGYSFCHCIARKVSQSRPFACDDRTRDSNHRKLINVTRWGMPQKAQKCFYLLPSHLLLCKKLL